MHNNNEYDTERDDELPAIEKVTSPADNKKVKPHIVRRNVEDYLERKALERRLKDVYDERY
jgi:hypothetical protein